MMSRNQARQFWKLIRDGALEDLCAYEYDQCIQFIELVAKEILDADDIKDDNKRKSSILNACRLKGRLKHEMQIAAEPNLDVERDFSWINDKGEPYSPSKLERIKSRVSYLKSKHPKFRDIDQSDIESRVRRGRAN